MKVALLSNPPTELAAGRVDNPSAHLIAIAEFGRDLASGRTAREGVESALRVLDRRLGALRSTVYRSSPRRRSLEQIAAHGICADQFRPRFGAGVIGRVADSGRPIVVPRVAHEPMALLEQVEPARWCSDRWVLVSVPLIGDGSPIGVLSAYFADDSVVEVGHRLSLLGVVATLLAEALGEGGLREVRVEPPRRGVETEASSAPTAVFEYSNMVGSSPSMRQVYEEVGQVARTNATALIRGESGTGKELVAHAIHANSTRAKQPFIKVNCAALPETLFESELFGHERGAFTGAHARKRGRFEVAQGGTLFLDEIGELSPATQAKLLRVLQSREYERLGGTETLKSDVRIIVATNRDLEAEVLRGGFRQDLYYRLNVFGIGLPPLRERRGDIPSLAEYFLQKYATEHGRNVTRIASDALDCLGAYAFPGNVRELENIVERAVVVCDGFVVREHHLPVALRDKPTAPALGRVTLRQSVMALERTLIDEALRKADGNCAGAARELGTTERIVRYKAKRYGLKMVRPRV